MTDNEKPNKKYSVLAFPSCLGTPMYTNSYLWAVVLCIIRSAANVEARIIDRNGNHLMVI